MNSYHWEAFQTTQRRGNKATINFIMDNFPASGSAIYLLALCVSEKSCTLEHMAYNSGENRDNPKEITYNRTGRGNVESGC